MNSIVDFVSDIVKLLIFAAVVLTVIVFWGYNKIRVLAEKKKRDWAAISASTMKKIELVKQLANAASVYQKGEQLTMLKISEDLTVSSAQLANQQSGQVLAAINAVAQRFPELKSNQHYIGLMEGIRESELALERARNQYNQSVMEYNTLRASFPHVLYSQLLGFSPAPYLLVETMESADTGIQQPIVSDDGERLNELLARAGTRAIGVAKTLAEQSRILAEKGVAKIQASAGGFNDQETPPKALKAPAPAKCQSCGQIMTGAEKFCPNCGTASSAPVVDPASKACVSCGADNPAPAKFCRECGKALLGELPAVG